MTPDYALLKRQNPIPVYLKRNGIKVTYPIHSAASFPATPTRPRLPRSSTVTNDGGAMPARKAATSSIS